MQLHGFSSTNPKGCISAGHFIPMLPTRGNGMSQNHKPVAHCRAGQRAMLWGWHARGGGGLSTEAKTTALVWVFSTAAGSYRLLLGYAAPSVHITAIFIAGSVRKFDFPCFALGKLRQNTKHRACAFSGWSGCGRGGSILGLCPHAPSPPHGSLSGKSVLPGQLMSDEGLALPAMRASPDAVMGAQCWVRQHSQKELSSAGCQRDSTAGDST